MDLREEQPQSRREAEVSQRVRSKTLRLRRVLVFSAVRLREAQKILQVS